MKTMRSFVALLAMAIARALVAQSSGTTVLEDIEHRPATLLNGERHTIVDPCFTGYFNFHHEIRTDSFYRNAPRQPESIPPVDYDFSKSPLLKVPGDWNTQSSDLFLYEDPVWYQRDFDYGAKAGLHGTADERWTAEFQANLYPAFLTSGLVLRVSVARRK